MLTTMGDAGSNQVERELTSLGARDALVLAAICLPPERPRRPGHTLRHAFLMRVIGARSSMKRLEKRGYLEAGWSVDYLGAHCEVTDLGTRVARAVGVLVAVSPDGGRLEHATIAVRVVLNLRFRM